MTHFTATVEVYPGDDPRNRLIQTLNAKLFQLDCADMIAIADIPALRPGEPRTQKIVMKVCQLRDLLDQLGYSLIRNEDAEEIIENCNEDADPPRCPTCGHVMGKAEGYRCSGFWCRECGHEDAVDSYY